MNSRHFFRCLAWALAVCLACPLLCQTGFSQTKLHWSPDKTKVGFATDIDNVKSFYLADAATRKTRMAFDLPVLANAYQKEFGETEFDNTSIRWIRPLDSDAIALMTKDGKLYQWDGKVLESAEMSQVISNPFFLDPRPSRPSRSRANVVFVNNLDHAVSLTWINSRGRPASFGKIEAGQTKGMATYVGHTWLFRDENGKRLGYCEAFDGMTYTLDANVLERLKERMPVVASSKPRGNRSSEWTSFAKDHNLWIKKKGAGEAVQLTQTGTPKNFFTNRVHWSPDQKYLVAFQRESVTPRVVHYVESSPREQLQPILRQYTYPKPGDDRDRLTVRLFSVEDQREVTVSNQLFKNAYALRFVDWRPDGKAFRIHYNQRGHQVMRLVEVETESGQTRTIAENTSETFLEYTVEAKRFFRFIGNDHLIWASESSGWNHLYRYDVSTGTVIHPITKGDWNVKRILEVDEEAETIWFFAVGVAKDQDPYHEHFCRVNFDGTGMKVLTDGDGTHSITFCENRDFFVDRYSRVDLGPREELRSAIDGQKVSELSRKNASSLIPDRPIPIRFQAPGRDGKTPIWGVIHLPKGFDKNKSYPVVENIYAGPHDHHVPKSFRTRYSIQQTVADAGMIVVQIDGMGTAWRSKAFHNVCYKNLRDAGFPDRIAWIKAAATKYPQMDIQRVGIWGGSAGGQNAMAALLWHNDFYQVAVADCGCHDNRMDKMWWNEQWMGYPIDESYKENSNVDNAHRLKGHLMLTVGEKDQNVDPASTTQVVDALIKANKDFEFVLIPGAGHGAGEHPWAVQKRLRFFKTHLGVD